MRRVLAGLVLVVGLAVGILVVEVAAPAPAFAQSGPPDCSASLFDPLGVVSCWVEGVWYQLGVVKDGISDTVASGTTVIQDAVDWVSQRVIELGLSVGSAISVMRDALLDQLDWVISGLGAITDGLTSAKDYLGDRLDTIFGAFATLGDLVGGLLEDLGAAIGTLGDLIGGFISGLASTLSGILNSILSAVGALQSFLGGLLTNIWSALGTMQSYLGGLLSSVWSAILGIPDFIKSKMQELLLFLFLPDDSHKAGLLTKTIAMRDKSPAGIVWAGANAPSAAVAAASAGRTAPCPSSFVVGASSFSICASLAAASAPFGPVRPIILAGLTVLILMAFYRRLAETAQH